MLADKLIALVLAGGQVAPNDPLFALTNGQPKALLSIANRPLWQWVVQALADTPEIDLIGVVGLPPQGGRTKNGVQPTVWLPEQGSIVANVQAGLAWAQTERPNAHVVVATADIPALTPDAVSAFIAQSRPFNAKAYYPLIPQTAIEATYPNAQRTYTRLSDATITGGNLGIVHPDLLATDPELWQTLFATRKSAWRQARLVGWRVVGRLLLGRLSTAHIEQTASHVLKQSVCTPLTPLPSLGMDIDKPHHYHLLNQHLSNG